MNWTFLRNQLVNHYHERPQEVARVDHWLRGIREGLEGLGSMGHQMHLAGGPSPASPEWPRRVFSLNYPEGFLCLCSQDFELLGPGWFDTLDQAKHADGMGEQFHGRGGVLPKSGLPAPIVATEPTRLDQLRRKGLE